MRKSGGILVGMGLLGLVALSGTANAAVIVEQGGGNFQGDSNVIFNACDAGVASGGPSTTVSGCLNQAHDYQVNFTSDVDLVTPSGGQSLVTDAAGVGFDYLKIWAEGDFATLITYINATSDGINGQPNDGQVQIVATIGGVEFDLGLFDMSESGNNIFRISTDDGSLFESLEFFAINVDITSIEFDEFRQTRLGPDEGVIPPNVSEPATIALFGISLLGLGLALRRRRLH